MLNTRLGKKRFEALDAFRGLAALFMVVFHLHLIGSVTETSFFKGSFIFVEFFFVLSGFVLTHGYGFKKNLQFSTFMKARFFRLYPLHLFIFVVFIILEIFKFIAYYYGNFLFNDMPFSKGTAISEIIPNILLLQSWTPYTNYLSFNSPSWSISIEFYLYALLFLSITLLGSIKKILWTVVPIIAFYLIAIESDLLVSSVLRGLSCFFGGALTYLLYRQIAHWQPPKLLGNLLEIMVLVAVIITVQTQFQFQYSAIVASLLFYIVTLIFAFESGCLSKLLKVNIFQYLGRISYSIYMTHSAIIFCVTSIVFLIQKITKTDLTLMVGHNRFLDLGSTTINNLIVILTIALVIVASHFTYKYIELKGQEWGKKLDLKKSLFQRPIINSGLLKYKNS
ncbi:MAG: acyltransferase [Thiotrichaceae bacterium]|nr:acyltransferase [Thiotrichaceae bacterium]